MCLRNSIAFRDETMKRQCFTIVNRLGLHARAAAQLVQTANRFQSDVTVEKEGMEVNGKSIMGILMLAAPKGSQIEISVSGLDMEEAFSAIAQLVENGFGED
jgi:phosphocarrier protein